MLIFLQCSNLEVVHNRYLPILRMFSHPELILYTTGHQFGGLFLVLELEPLLVMFGFDPLVHIIPLDVIDSYPEIIDHFIISLLYCRS